MDGIREIEFPLAQFKYATRTNISKRKLSNLDACLLLLAANGPTMKTADLKILLRAWRPLEGITYRTYSTSGSYDRAGVHELHFTYLFNAYYGHVSSSPLGVPYKPYYGSKRSNQCFWWTNKRGEVQISVPGYKRLAWIKKAMADVWGETIPSLENCVTPNV